MIGVESDFAVRFSFNLADKLLFGPIKFIGFPNVDGANEYACRSPGYLSAVNGFKIESIIHHHYYVVILIYLI